MLKRGSSSSRRAAAIVLGAVLSLAAAGAGATNCAALTTRPPDDVKSHFFVLAYFGGPPAGGKADERKADLEALAARFREAILDTYDAIMGQLQDQAPELGVLTCDYGVGDGDFSRSDVDLFLQMHAIDVVWHAQDGGGSSIVYLSLPRYQRAASTTRRRAEVATRVESPTGRNEEELAVALSKPDVTQRTLLALSVGLMSLQKQGATDDPARLKVAKISLCQAGANLALLPSTIVRPTTSALADDLKQVVKDALAEVDQRARQIGLDLVTTQPWKLACRPL